MAAREEIATDVILRDGSTLRLRAPLADDTDAMLEFFGALSDRSRYLRFHGFPAMGPELVAPFLDPDWDERGALAGWLEGRIVALANFVRLRDPRRAEVAFTVADEYQSRGIGTRLLEQLAALAARGGHRAVRRRGTARERGTCSSSSTTPASRSRATSTADRSRCTSRSRRPSATRPAGGRSATTSAVARVAPARSSSRRAVAVIGASARRGSIGGELFRNVLAADFTRRRLPGEPRRRRRRRRARLPARSRRSPTPSTSPSSAFPASTCSTRPSAALDARRARALRHLGGLRGDRDGRARATGAAARARPRARRPPDRAELPRHLVGAPRLNATFAPRAFPAGTIGFSSQSGALGLALLERGQRTRARAVGVRVDRQQGRRLVQRPARVVGGRRRRRISCCSTSSRSGIRARSRASRAASRARSRSSR